MITFEEAYRIVIDHKADFGIEKVPLENSLGRILGEDWHADRDLPPFDRVTMDGIAVHFDTAQESNNQLQVVDIVGAGQPLYRLKDKKTVVEIMTGAMLPEGADTIIRYEDVNIEQNIATINTSYQKGQNIHVKGSDRKKGELLVRKGTMIGAPEIGIAASIGKSNVVVQDLPKALIVSSGDELVDIVELPKPHQIRKSNVFQIAAVLEAYGLTAEKFHLNDNFVEISKYLAEAIGEYELIILSGGVSMGKFDFIPRALEKLKVKQLFHKVKQRPGKPFWFGVHDRGCTFFALPGNPVSSFMCSVVYLKAWLDASLISSTKPQFALLAENVNFKPELTYFLEVSLEISQDGTLLAHPQKGNGSGDLVNLSNADAFMRLPSDREHFTKGELFPIHLYR